MASSETPSALHLSLPNDGPLRLVVVESEALTAFDMERHLAKSGHHVVATLDRVDRVIAALSDLGAGIGIDGIVAGPALLGSVEGRNLENAARFAGTTLYASPAV